MIQMATTLPLLAMLTPPSFAEYAALIPGSILSFAALVVIILDVFHTHETDREYLSYASALAFAATFVACVLLWQHPLDSPSFHGMLYLDRYSLFFGGLIAVSGFMTSLFAPSFLKLINMDRSEFYILTLFSASGMVFMVSAADLLSVFISLEVMSIPLYCIAGFVRQSGRSAEAGLKYFILGAFSTALTLYGIALIYGMTGTTNLEGVAAALNNMAPANNEAAFTASNTIVIIGSFLVTSGFLFKVAAAPFHIWTPDVYTGTPTPSTGFMATGVKAASFAVLVRILLVGFNSQDLTGGLYGYGWIDLLYAFACFSVVLGNFAAMAQTNVKRMLAYSSIAHAGYILVGVVAANVAADYFLFNDSVLFYLFAYTFTTLGAFGVLSYLKKSSGRMVETYDDLKGVGLKYPLVGLLMAVFMFSSAGIPPAAGFLAKFYIFRAAVDVGAATDEPAFYILAILAVLSSICGVYYYLKVLVKMYMSEESSDVEIVGTTGAKLGLIVCALAVLGAGIFPQDAITLAQKAVVGMEGPSHVAKIQEMGEKLLLERKAEALEREFEMAQQKEEAGERLPSKPLKDLTFQEVGTLLPVNVKANAEGDVELGANGRVKNVELQPLQGGDLPPEFLEMLKERLQEAGMGE